MAYSYDVFLSYASEDKDWASQVEARLAPDFKVFRDAKGLTPGSPWEPEVESALEGSEHFVVLWSGNAKKSEWVQREISEFRSRADADEQLKATKAGGDDKAARRRAPLVRRQIFVNLEAVEHAYRSIQGVDLPPGFYEKQKDRTANLDAAAKPVWESAIADLKRGLRNADTRTTIPVCVVTMLDREFSALNVAQTRGTNTSLADALTALGTELPALAPRYGTAREDWQPFGGTEPVHRILARVETELNARIARYHVGHGLNPVAARQRGYRFEYVDFIDPALSATAVPDVIQRLRSGPAIILIDPLSLYADEVFNRFPELGPCFQNEDAAISVLGPCGAGSVYTRVRELVTGLAKPHLRLYFHPPIPSEILASCGTSQDELDLERLVVASIGRRAPRRPPGGSAGGGASYSRMRGRR